MSARRKGHARPAVGVPGRPRHPSAVHATPGRLPGSGPRFDVMPGCRLPASGPRSCDAGIPPGIQPRRYHARIPYRCPEPGRYYAGTSPASRPRSMSCPAPPTDVPARRRAYRARPPATGPAAASLPFEICHARPPPASSTRPQIATTVDADTGPTAGVPDRRPGVRPRRCDARAPRARPIITTGATYRAPGPST